MSRAIEISATHRLALWTRAGRVVATTFRASRDDLLWESDLETAPEDFRALLVTYDGVRMGAWWREDWSQDLLRICHQDPAVTAETLQRFHLPVLASTHRRAIRHCAQTFPGVFLSRWIAGIDGAGVTSEKRTGWLSALREIFRHWKPSSDAAVGVVGALAGSRSPGDLDSMFATVSSLSLVNPILMGRVVGTWIRTELVKRISPLATLKLLDQAFCLLAEEGEISRARKRTDTLGPEVARFFSTGVGKEANLHFLEKELLKPALQTLTTNRRLGSREEANLARALHVDAFRQLLALRVLAWVRTEADQSRAG